MRFSSDDGLFFESKNNYNGFKFDNIRESVDLRGDNTLIKGTFNQITFTMSSKVKVISRAYEKMTTAFASIGGFANALIIITKTILFLWSDNNIIIYLSSILISKREADQFYSNFNSLSKFEIKKSEIKMIKNLSKNNKEPSNKNNQENPEYNSIDDFLNVQGKQKRQDKNDDVNKLNKENIIPNAKNLIKEFKLENLEEENVNPRNFLKKESNIDLMSINNNRQKK